MIDQAAFIRAWRHLCTRFGRKVDADEAAEYLDFLDGQLDTDSFLAAARVLWATAKWFPRPADFVLVGAAGEWRLVLEAVDRYAPPDTAWLKPWGALSDRSREACQQLGGLAAMRAVYERDVLRLKAAWEAAYEQEVGLEAAATLLPAERVPALLEA